jgi:hypothetical protein
MDMTLGKKIKISLATSSDREKKTTLAIRMN